MFYNRNDIRAIKHSATNKSTYIEVNKCCNKVPLSILAMYAKVDIAYYVYSVGTSLQVGHDQLQVSYNIHPSLLYIQECRDSSVQAQGSAKCNQVSSAGTNVSRVLGSYESDLKVLIFGKQAIRQRPSYKAGAVDSQPLLRQQIDYDLITQGSVLEATCLVAKQFYLVGFGKEIENINSDDNVYSIGKTGYSEAIEVDGLTYIALLDNVTRFSESKESSYSSYTYG